MPVAGSQKPPACQVACLLLRRGRSDLQHARILPQGGEFFVFVVIRQVAVTLFFCFLQATHARSYTILTPIEVVSQND